MLFMQRPSETESNSLSESTTSHSTHSTASPASPQSSHSAKTSHSFDQLAALQLQLSRNSAQIEANEARMRELQAMDTRTGADIQDRLSAVSQLNQQLSILREMLARAERVSRGEFGLGVDE